MNGLHVNGPFSLAGCFSSTNKKQAVFSANDQRPIEYCHRLCYFIKGVFLVKFGPCSKSYVFKNYLNYLLKLQSKELGFFKHIVQKRITKS